MRSAYLVVAESFDRFFSPRQIVSVELRPSKPKDLSCRNILMSTIFHSKHNIRGGKGSSYGLLWPPTTLDGRKRVEKVSWLIRRGFEEEVAKAVILTRSRFKLTFECG